MRRPTIQIALFRQPPVYMVLAVVLVSLVPLGLQLLGHGPLEPGPEPISLRAAAAFARVSVPPAPTRCPTVSSPTVSTGDPEAPDHLPAPMDDDEPLQVIAMALEEAPTAEEPLEVLIIEDVDDPTASLQQGRRAPSARGLLSKAKRAYAKGQPKTAYRLAGKSVRRRPSPAARLVQTKAACELQDRGAARAAYRGLPRGAARKDARRTCRSAGILLL